MKVLQQASQEHSIRLFLAWEYGLIGYVFPCDRNGEVDQNLLTTGALRDLVALRQGKHWAIPATVQPVIIQREHILTHYAVG